MNRTVFLSSGTVVPPDVTHATRRAAAWEAMNSASRVRSESTRLA